MTKDYAGWCMMNYNNTRFTKFYLHADRFTPAAANGSVRSRPREFAGGVCTVLTYYDDTFFSPDPVQLLFFYSGFRRKLLADPWATSYSIYILYFITEYTLLEYLLYISRVAYQARWTNNTASHRILLSCIVFVTSSRQSIVFACYERQKPGHVRSVMRRTKIFVFHKIERITARGNTCIEIVTLQKNKLNKHGIQWKSTKLTKKKNRVVQCLACTHTESNGITYLVIYLRQAGIIWYGWWPCENVAQISYIIKTGL